MDRVVKKDLRSLSQKSQQGADIAHRPGQLRIKPVHDIVILQEVIAVNPFSTKWGWTEIANTLRGDKRMPGKMTPRCLKERTLRILSFYKNEEFAALRRSGTEEEYKERERLLAVVLSMSESQESSTSQSQPSTSVFAQRDLLYELREDRRSRSATLHRLCGDSSSDVGDIAGPSQSATGDDDSGEEEASSSKHAKRLGVPISTVRAGIYEYLVCENKRSKVDLELRRMQIENERKRLELKERKMNEEHERRKQEMEERRQRDAEAAADRKQLLQLVQTCLEVMQNMQK